MIYEGQILGGPLDGEWFAHEYLKFAIVEGTVMQMLGGNAELPENATVYEFTEGIAVGEHTIRHGVWIRRKPE